MLLNRYTDWSQASLEKLKQSANRNSTSVKSLQKELQAAQLQSGQYRLYYTKLPTLTRFTEQCGGDLAAAQEQLSEIDSTLKGQQEEIEALKQEQSQLKASKDRDI